MLMTTEPSTIFGALTVIVLIALFIRGLLLAGRLVRAVEKIAEKPEK